MKKVSMLKLSQINKGSMVSRQMGQLWGGNVCNFGYVNHYANYDQGKCSCQCGATGDDYYGPDGLNADASALKYKS